MTSPDSNVARAEGSKDRTDGAEAGLSSKERIELSAVELFAERGFQGAVVKEIVERANVAKPTLYYHFQDKEELYLTVVRGAFERIAARIREREFTSDGPVERIRELLEFTSGLCDEMPERIAVLFTAWYSPSGSVPRKSGLDELRERMLRLLRETIKPGALSQSSVGGTDLECAAELTLGVMSQMVWHSLLQEGGECPADMVTNLASALVASWE